MRYAINFLKVVNELVPHFLGGRKIISYLHAAISPLQSVNDEFRIYANESMIAYMMTSQVFKLEWYLNRKFAKYFIDTSDRIVIVVGTGYGAPVYYEPEDALDDFELSDGVSCKTELRLYGETPDDRRSSFVVSSPAIDVAKIDRQDYIDLLSAEIDRFRVAGKTFRINIKDK